MVPAIWEEAFGLYFDPIGKLHASSSALIQDTIFKGTCENYGVHWIRRGFFEDLHFGLILGIKKCGRGFYRQG